MSEHRDPDTDQPLPVPNEGAHIHDLVAEDLAARKQLGTRKYGAPLQAHNGRNPMRDLYEELLDAAVYARAALEEFAHLYQEPPCEGRQALLLTPRPTGDAATSRSISCPTPTSTPTR